VPVVLEQPTVSLHLAKLQLLVGRQRRQTTAIENPQNPSIAKQYQESIGQGSLLKMWPAQALA